MSKFGKLWAGNETSFEVACSAVASALVMQEAGKQAPQSELLTIQDNVGVIAIDGSMIPGEAGFLSYFGAVGYGDIRNALVEAAMNPEVKSIMLNINSGGGAVDGCADCASLIARVNKVKPVMTYADGAIASAAYWIGSQASAVLIGPTTIAGSLGVVLKHAEMSKMRAAVGITDTVIRTGEFKQLANPVEPLTDVAKAELQQLSDDIYSVFLGQVADARGMSAQAVDAKMGKGREFVGQRAVSVGLADGIATYEGALAASKAMQLVDNGVSQLQNVRSTGASMLTKKPLTAEQIAAIASGAVVDASAAQQQAEATANDAATAAATAAAAAAAAAGAEVDPATAAATAAAAEAATVAAAAATAATTAAATAAAAEGELVKFLRGELATAQAGLTAAAVEKASMTAELATMRDTQPKLLEIARSAVGKMKVALGGTAAAAAAMTPLEVVAAHAETSAAFNKAFVVGGAASTSSAESLEKPKKPVDLTNVHSIHAIAARGSK